MQTKIKNAIVQVDACFAKAVLFGGAVQQFTTIISQKEFPLEGKADYALNFFDGYALDIMVCCVLIQFKIALPRKEQP